MLIAPLLLRLSFTVPVLFFLQNKKEYRVHCIVAHMVCSVVGKSSTSVSSVAKAENHVSNNSATFTDRVCYKYILNAQNKEDTVLLDHRAASWCKYVHSAAKFG